MPHASGTWLAALTLPFAPQAFTAPAIAVLCTKAPFANRPGFTPFRIAPEANA
ncbi:MAG: hypothetical protein FJ091_09350 [Deltaproteobacteria bacterium]|nr:hypothetical protein [Deltaproteobacteria bacterium]